MRGALKKRYISSGILERTATISIHTMTRPSQAQLEALVEFLEQNPEIAKGLLRTSQAKQETKRKWCEIASFLNGLGGAIKDGSGWSKYWAEKKCTLKKLCAQQAQSMQRTGGGVQVLPNLAPLDFRLVAVLGGQTFAYGNPEVAVDPFPQRSQSQSLQATEELLPTAIQPRLLVVSQEEDVAQNTQEENMAQNVDLRRIEPQPTSSATNAPRRRSQTRRLQTQLDIEVNRFQDIEEKRVEAELKSAQAMADAAASLEKCANAIREGAQLVANALIEISRNLSPPTK